MASIVKCWLFATAISFFAGIFAASADIIHFSSEAYGIRSVELRERLEAKDDSQETIGSSNSAVALAPIGPLASVALWKHQNFTLTGAPGEMVTLNLRNFKLSGSSTFTLQGTATTTFVINVTHKFSLSEKARIVLFGGVQWATVYFNVQGSGPAVSMNGASWLYGRLNAPQRTVRLFSRATVYGSVIANRLVRSNRARIITPPDASP